MWAAHMAAALAAAAAAAGVGVGAAAGGEGGEGVGAGEVLAMVWARDAGRLYVHMNAGWLWFGGGMGGDRGG